MEAEEEEGVKRALSSEPTDPGKIHIDDEFRKSKRNLMWFCSFAVLLGVVQSSSGSDVQPPLLGQSVSIHIGLLRFLVWLGCLYALIGFYRQVRDVDLINSEALYGAAFVDIRQNLYEVGNTLVRLRGTLEWAVRSVPYFYDLPYNIPQAQERIRTAVRRLGEAGLQLVKQPPAQQKEQTFSAWLGAQDDLVQTLDTEMGGIARSADYSQNQVVGLREVVEKLGPALTRFERLERNFNRLSQRIKSDHRFLYIWYDKYLGYLMFLLASIATFWRIAYP